MTNTIKLWTLLAAGIVCTAAACEGNAKGGDSGSGDGKITASLLAEQNLRRAMQITDSAARYCFEGNAVLKMLQHYNPYTSKTEGVVSIWGYTASVEAVNAVLHGLKAYKDAGSPALYDAHYQRYADLLAKLYDNADYYLGSFSLTSYSQCSVQGKRV